MKKKDVVFFIISLLLTVAQVVVACLDFVLWLKIMLSIILFSLIVLIIILRTKARIKHTKKTQQDVEGVALKPNNLSMLDMYAILQIPPQYNADGTLKDVYELLQLEPQYDENGNRIITIYEMLKINPKFDKNGNEVPQVVVIKNRVNAIVKLKSAPMPLTYVPREQLISGYQPIILPPIVGVEEQTKPSIKQIPVVKLPPKPAGKPKPSAPKPNLPGKSAKISISKPQIKYSSVKEFGANIFEIEKPAPVIKKVDSTPKSAPVEVKNNPVNNKAKHGEVTKVVINKVKTPTPAKSETKSSEAEIEMI